ncbi:MAG: GntR family transcriptional regulator [Verrucomicrobiae bacterium]|nr:GntR family transcriptional regulator [Verrucomicrobiae bacterium]
MKTIEIGKALLDQIHLGEWKTGQRIPSERQIAEEMRVSRIPVRMAIAQLARMGILEQRHGSGTFLMKMPDSATERSLRDYFAIHSRLQNRGKFRAKRVVVQRRYRFGFYHGMTSSDPIALSLIGGIMAYAQHRDHDLTVKSVSENFPKKDQLRQALPQLISSATDGLIVSFAAPPENLTLYKKIPVPTMVLCYGGLSATLPNSISLDVEETCHQALQKLAGLGHRQVAILEKEYGLPTPKLSHVCDFLRKELKLDRMLHFFGGAPLLELLPQMNGVTALYVSDDVYCLEVCRQLAEKGLRVGKDLAVISQTNRGIERGLPAAVGRMEFDIAGWGHTAAHMLEYRLDENLPSLPPIKLGAYHLPGAMQVKS